MIDFPGSWESPCIQLQKKKKRPRKILLYSVYTGGGLTKNAADYRFSLDYVSASQLLTNWIHHRAPAEERQKAWFSELLLLLTTSVQQQKAPRKDHGSPPPPHKPGLWIRTCVCTEYCTPNRWGPTTPVVTRKTSTFDRTWWVGRSNHVPPALPPKSSKLVLVLDLAHIFEEYEHSCMSLVLPIKINGMFDTLHLQIAPWTWVVLKVVVLSPRQTSKGQRAKKKEPEKGLVVCGDTKGQPVQRSGTLVVIQLTWLCINMSNLMTTWSTIRNEGD